MEWDTGIQTNFDDLMEVLFQPDATHEFEFHDFILDEDGRFQVCIMRCHEIPNVCLAFHAYVYIK